MGLKSLSVLAAICLATGAAEAQDAPTRAERIMYGFVPEVSRLELVTGEDLAAKYAGHTIAGIYGVTVHDDQRYVETLRVDASVSYREGGFQSAGHWFVKGDQLCFIYDEQPGREHCFYEFRYGDCMVSYPQIRVIVGGKPLRPERWSSVHRFVGDDFAWPDVPASEADEFSCFLSLV